MRALLFAGCLAACSPAPPPAPEPASASRAGEAPGLQGQWRLTTMNGRKPGEAGPASDVPITLTAGLTTLRAQSQCIAIWRTYEREGERLRVAAANPGPVCARSLSPWETEFERTLSGIDSGARKGGALRLSGPTGELTFEAAAPLQPEPFTGRWRLASVSGAAPSQGDPIEITVTPDRITANSCVFAGWGYRQYGRLLEVEPLTAAVCERTLSPLEARFAGFMAGLTRATRLENGRLILDSASDQLEFTPVPASGPASTRP